MPRCEVASQCNGVGPRYWSVAIIVWVLSRKPHLAAYYLHCHDAASIKNDAGEWPDEAYICLKLLQWWEMPTVWALVQEAANDATHRSMVLAMEFLVRSAVAEHIFSENRRNRSVQPHAVVSRYLQYWMYRGIPDFLEETLLKLTHCKCARGHFLRKMREEWGFRSGPMSISRDISVDETTSAVSTVAYESYTLSEAV